MADKLFELEIVRPDKVFFRDQVTMVEYNTTEGETGVYAGHIPMTQIIAPGELVITTPEGDRRAALHEGFVEILPEKVMILAQAVEWPEDIDVKRAEEARIRAQRRLAEGGGPGDVLRAEMALKRALLRLGVAGGK